MDKYPDLKFVKAALLDPARTRAASAGVRDAMFTRLDCFVYLLHKMGIWEFTRACDVPPERWFNMDEVSTDPTKHKKKALVDGKSLSRFFQVTPEGDRMNYHMTTCLFTCANGKFFICFIVA